MMENNNDNSTSLAHPIPPEVNYAEEMVRLLSLYQQGGSVSFKDFRDIWKLLDFSSAHLAVKSNETHYLHFLYYSFLAIMVVNMQSPNPSPSVKFGAIYGLYLLYHTQIIIPPVKIIVNPAIWRAILAIEREAQDMGNEDCYHVLKKMRIDGIFLFCASLHPASSDAYIPREVPNGINNFGNERSDNIDALDPNSSKIMDLLDIDRIEKLDKAYYVAKTQPQLSDATYDDISLLPQPPAPLRFAYVGLAAELRNILAEHEKNKLQCARRIVSAAAAYDGDDDNNNNNNNNSSSNNNNNNNNGTNNNVNLGVRQSNPTSTPATTTSRMFTPMGYSRRSKRSILPATEQVRSSVTTSPEESSTQEPTKRSAPRRSTRGDKST